MERAVPAPADAAAVTEVLVALESSLYGQTAYSQADLEDEWADLDLERDTIVVRDGGRIVAYGAVHEAGEVLQTEGHVHPAAHGRGIGRLLAAGLEQDAVRRGARRVHNRVFEADVAARGLLLADAFGRFWERGEHSVGLGVDAASATGAFRLYERAGMSPALGWVIYERELGGAA